jgi:hypothetical protein
MFRGGNAFPDLQGKNVSIILPWRWRQNAYPKHGLTSIRPYNIPFSLDKQRQAYTQKTETFSSETSVNIKQTRWNQTRIMFIVIAMRQISLGLENNVRQSLINDYGGKLQAKGRFQLTWNTGLGLSWSLLHIRDPMRWMNFFNLPNPSYLTRPWGFTQHLTEMSTRSENSVSGE